MKQRTHTWLAIRALALLEEEDDVPELVKMLKPHIRSTTIGAWLPDMADARTGGAAIEYHILKMKPYSGSQKQRFVRSRDKLLAELGPHRRVGKFLQDWDGVLGADWWKQAYKADPAPGGHLPNRAQALTITLTDQMVLGDPKVAALVPGTVAFAHQLDPEARTTREQVATYFFMLSHFLADACQPCHCDKRKLSGYDNGLHKEMEAHWNKIVGTGFEKAKLMASTDSPTKILKAARAVDKKFGMDLPAKVPGIVAHDTWLEMMTVCRASFAVASIIANPSAFPYGTTKRTTFKAVFDPEVVPELLADFDAMVMQDAVLNIAIVWKEIWKGV